MDEVNVVLTFLDQDDQEWLAAAIMTPLQRQFPEGREFCEVEDMPDRVFRLNSFKVITE